MSRGFVLVEIAIALLVLTLAVVALVPVFTLNIRGNKSTEQTQAAVFLASQLLEEVRLRRWDENTPIPALYTDAPSGTLGPDAGETASDKRTFDDVDDFDGWQETTVMDPVMRPIPGFPAYNRTVAVGYVTAALAVSATATDHKQVTVCTQIPGRSPACLDTLLTNH